MRYTQRKAKDINSLISQYNLTLSKKDTVQEAIDKENNIHLILVNKEPWFFYHQDILLPTLKLLLQKPDLLPKITVDMGAIKFVVNGADIMRPGITNIQDSIEQNQFVVIIDENNHKPLCVGKALLNTQEMKIQEKGKSVKNIHFVGDAIWKSA